jgi:hypothetical protein
VGALHIATAHGNGRNKRLQTIKAFAARKGQGQATL